MSNYQFGYCTDIGIRKNVNQDSFMIREAVFGECEVLLAVVCDGMGGLSKGELASASIVRAFDEWFRNELPSTGIDFEQIQAQWNDLVVRGNQKICSYGEANGIQLGTTLTGLLIVSNDSGLQYFIVHVGDSRCYQMTEENGANQISCLTEDQTLVAREIKRGNMTPEQAENDPRRSVLLQCIGASNTVEPAFYYGCSYNNDQSQELGQATIRLDMASAYHKIKGFLLCSDGFRHVITEEEMLFELQSMGDWSQESINQSLRNLVDLNMERMESDNITALFICCG